MYGQLRVHVSVYLSIFLHFLPAVHMSPLCVTDTEMETDTFSPPTPRSTEAAGCDPSLRILVGAGQVGASLPRGRWARVGIQFFSSSGNQTLPGSPGQ